MYDVFQRFLCRLPDLSAEEVRALKGGAATGKTRRMTESARRKLAHSRLSPEDSVALLGAFHEARRETPAPDGIRTNVEIAMDALALHVGRERHEACLDRAAVAAPVFTPDGVRDARQAATLKTLSVNQLTALLEDETKAQRVRPGARLQSLASLAGLVELGYMRRSADFARAASAYAHAATLLVRSLPPEVLGPEDFRRFGTLRTLADRMDRARPKSPERAKPAPFVLRADAPAFVPVPRAEPVPPRANVVNAYRTLDANACATTADWSAFIASASGKHPDAVFRDCAYARIGRLLVDADDHAAFGEADLFPSHYRAYQNVAARARYYRYALRAFADAIESGLARPTLERPRYFKDREATALAEDALGALPRLSVERKTPRARRVSDYENSVADFVLPHLSPLPDRSGVALYHAVEAASVPSIGAGYALSLRSAAALLRDCARRSAQDARDIGMLGTEASLLKSVGWFAHIEHALADVASIDTRAAADARTIAHLAADDDLIVRSTLPGDAP